MRFVFAYLAGLLEVGSWVGQVDGLPTIQVSAHREACLLLQRRLGAGEVYKRSGRLWTWSVRGAEVPDILTGVQPFLSRPRHEEVRAAITEAYGPDTGAVL